VTIFVVLLNFAQLSVAIVAALVGYLTNRKALPLIITICASVIVFGAQLQISRDQAQQARSLSEETVRLRADAARLSAEVSGGNSFPVVVMQNVVAPLRFKIFNKGEAPLRDVTVILRRGTDEPKSMFIGSIPGKGAFDFPFVVTPVLDQESSYVGNKQIDWWMFETVAANGQFAQQIQFRHHAQCDSDWEGRTVYVVKYIPDGQPIDLRPP
jgi:hypothetical protein